MPMMTGPRYEEILTKEALSFVEDLARRFGPRVQELLARRAERQRRLEQGELYDFLPETANVRSGAWTVAKLPDEILDRRVEITGPVDRKMIINALNSGAKVFMADFEDSNAPTWANQVEGQINLKDALRREIRLETPKKTYTLNAETAVLFVRPRGWHLVERHMMVDGAPVPGGLFDFGLYFFHNARVGGRYFYLPKMESHLEARLWNDVFVHAQKTLGVPQGTIKATVLIETLPAAFEMDEILYELREHSAGLNCGRWDYIFSFIKKLGTDPSRVLPDRGQVTMDKAFLRAYSLLAIKTCHRRGVHAMGGMAAQIPIKDDPAANDAAMAKVKADKLREVTDGHDGTWVAHPGLVALAMGIFDEHMKGPNQIDRKRDDVHVTQKDLLELPPGTRTEEGLRHNVKIGVRYLEAWLRGNGCVPIFNLMEDAATAEISRAQVWQQLRHGIFTKELFAKILAEETAGLTGGKFAEAARLFETLSLSDTFIEFLTLPAYDLLLAGEGKGS